VEENVAGLIESLITLVSRWGLSVIGALALLLVGRVACPSCRAPSTTWR
jgi:hypothetical protein